MSLNYDKARRYQIYHKVTLLAFSVFMCLILCGLASGCAGKKEDPRSVGFDKPLKESQVLKLSLESDYLGMKVRFLVYLPKGYGDGKDYPVWYGLNGHSSNETMWMDNGIGETADKLIDSGDISPIIMVFPCTKDATYKEIAKDFEDDGKFDERNMDQFICKELVPYIDAHYYTITSSDNRYIGGFSMGGMIALRIAFHHTDMFSKVGGYSAAVISSDYSDKQLEKWLYPNDDIDALVDISDFDKEKGFDKLTVCLDAGKVNDPFSVGLQSLYDALQKRGIKSEFELYDGGHTLRKTSLKGYLEFYAAKD